MVKPEKETVTYKAIPHPLPEKVRQRLIEAGKAALAGRRNSTRIDKNYEDVNLLEDTIRNEFGVTTTREVFIPNSKQFNTP